MKIHRSVTADRVIETTGNDENTGFCINCGEEQSGVEPDATGYKCDSCGHKTVYGAEELIFHLEG